ncbi:N-acetyllactosaminide beta-1,3-N-acetylglucosaminyltransferase 2 [Genypterus blacodes]|uniref:N-acetyllactosaminide beta-1,3-N-acetylglucosaminyltransferase 2 n=1 Tax=Genypterus blacodes TaxID=154954 RepID=UPI003F766207
MAWRCYRWRRVLVCLCTPCILMGLLFSYITVMVCSDMMVTRRDVKGSVLSTFFIAPGLYRNEGLAPLPKTFWDLQQNGDAIWNGLQLGIDRNHNPILRPGNRANGCGSKTSILKENSGSDELPLQLHKFVRHMHQRDYPVLIQPKAACGAGAEEEEGPPLLLIAIKTMEMNFNNRQAIRQTWGQVGWVAGRRRNSSREAEGGFVRRVFLLGKDGTESLGGELLQLESRTYGDILQWDFRDTFFNLTLKDVLFWNWFSQHCQGARFVLKGDDDVFVNTPAMLNFLQDQLQKKREKDLRDFMVGDVIASAAPNRKNRSKYFIPNHFFKGLYPTYAGGGGVVYSGLLAKRLSYISKRIHLFPIDDVYVGMCMVRLNASPDHHPAFLTFDFSEKEESSKCAYHKVLLVHKRSYEQVGRLWLHLKDTEAECWNETLRGEKENESH